MHVLEGDDSGEISEYPDDPRSLRPTQTQSRREADWQDMVEGCAEGCRSNVSVITFANFSTRRKQENRELSNGYDNIDED
ncbi:hypothetical protein Trydic_g10860 [Trypoxylus dichotomus]